MEKERNQSLLLFFFFFFDGCTDCRDHLIGKGQQEVRIHHLDIIEIISDVQLPYSHEYSCIFRLLLYIFPIYYRMQCKDNEGPSLKFSEL